MLPIPTRQIATSYAYWPAGRERERERERVWVKWKGFKIESSMARRIWLRNKKQQQQNKYKNNIIIIIFKIRK